MIRMFPDISLGALSEGKEQFAIGQSAESYLSTVHALREGGDLLPMRGMIGVRECAAVLPGSRLRVEVEQMSLLPAPLTLRSQPESVLHKLNGVEVPVDVFSVRDRVALALERIHVVAPYWPAVGVGEPASFATAAGFVPLRPDADQMRIRLDQQVQPWMCSIGPGEPAALLGQHAPRRPAKRRLARQGRQVARPIHEEPECVGNELSGGLRAGELSAIDFIALPARYAASIDTTGKYGSNTSFISVPPSIGEDSTAN